MAVRIAEFVGPLTSSGAQRARANQQHRKPHRLAILHRQTSLKNQS
jgi:hypothetical protein